MFAVTRSACCDRPWRSVVLAACLAGLACLATTALATGSPEVPPFRSVPGRFSVQLPEAPEQEPSQDHSEGGPTITGTTFSLLRGDTEYRIEYYDLPRFAAVLLPDRLILRRAVASLVKDVNGRPRSQRSLAHQGHPALIATYAISGESEDLERSLLVLAEGRLYIASARWPSVQPNAEFAERFFRSFSVWISDPSEV
jgi:hypothetical protein